MVKITANNNCEVYGETYVVWLTIDNNEYAETFQIKNYIRGSIGYIKSELKKIIYDAHGQIATHVWVKIDEITEGVI